MFVLSPTDIYERHKGNKQSWNTSNSICKQYTVKLPPPAPVAHKHTPTSVPKQVQPDTKLKSDDGQDIL